MRVSRAVTSLVLLWLPLVSACRSASVAAPEEVRPAPRTRPLRPQEIVRRSRQMCEVTPVVGYRKGIRLTLRAGRKRLESSRAELGFERYKELSQQLEGYSAGWESLYQTTFRDCVIWATCIVMSDGTVVDPCARQEKE